MKIISKLLSVAIAILMVGCSLNNRTAKNNNLSIVGSGNVVSQARALPEFDRVEVGLTFDVTIRQDEDFSVVLYSDDNFIDYMQAEVQGTTLSFGFVPGFAYDLHGVTLRADVTMPELTGLELSGSSHANLDGLRSRGILDIELSGSSFLDGSLEVESSNLTLYGSSHVELSGSTQELMIDACGSNSAELSNYRAGVATVQASCNSRIVINVVDVLDGEASQNSQVYYVTPPTTINIITHEGARVGQK